MDHVNKTLLLSLKQDLISLNESIECLKTDKDIDSWLFPTKNHQFVKKYIQEKDILEASNVKILLELIIDRLYVGIRLVQVIIQDKFKTNGLGNCLILQPQQMTIGCSFENLRKMVINLFETMANERSISKKDEYYTSHKKHGKTQTEIVAMDKCDSCASATSCMRNLLSLLEIHRDDIYHTQQIQSSIYDLTQFGCMMQTTVTIEKSLKTLIGKLLDKETENEGLRQRIEALNKEVKKKNGKIILLEQECAAFSEKNKKNSSEMSQANSKIEVLSIALSKSESQINALNGSLSSMNSELSLYKKEFKTLLRENVNLSKSFKRVKEVLDDVVKKLPMLERNVLRIEKDHRHFLEEFSVLNTVFDALNTTLVQITKNHDMLENKVKILCCNSSDDVANLEKNFTNFREKLQQMMIQSRVKDVKITDSIPKIQIKGNPIEDISKQIEENNERIRALQNENAKLTNIVAKFNNLKK